MKQNITKEQWDELVDNEKWFFARNITTFNKKNYLPTIGQMIEFLEDDLSIINYNKNNKEDVKLRNSIFTKHKEGWNYCVVTCCRSIYNDKLADALWEACKNKLTKQNYEKV